MSLQRSAAGYALRLAGVEALKGEGEALWAFSKHDTARADRSLIPPIRPE